MRSGTRRVREWKFPVISFLSPPLPAFSWSTAGSSQCLVLSWSSVRGSFSGTLPPQVSSASETVWFSQLFSPFTFSEDRLSLVCTEGDRGVSSQNRCFRRRHPQLIQERNLFPVQWKRENTRFVFYFGGLSETKSLKIKRSLVVSTGHTEKVLPL